MIPIQRFQLKLHEVFVSSPSTARIVPPPLPRLLDVCPQHGQLEVEHVEGLGVDDRLVLVDSQECVVTMVEAEDLERSQMRVEQPDVAHRLACVDGKLVRAVDLGRAGTEDLAQPVRRKRDVRVGGEERETIASPSREVRNEDVVTQVELGLEEKEPTSGTTTAAFERRPELFAQGGSRGSMRKGRPRMQVQLTVDHLGHLSRRSGKDVLIGGACCIHDLTVAPGFIAPRF